MSSVREAYEALILREDGVVQGIQTCERALSVLVDELVYRESESSCLETAEAICETIRQREEDLRRGMVPDQVGKGASGQPVSGQT